jgi:hypothetical protein
MHVVKGAGLRTTLRNTAAFQLRAALLLARARFGAATTSRAALARRVGAFNARNVVLTVAAGRTATETASRLFGHLPDTTSLHEPEPHHRFILARVQHDPAAAARFFWHVQVPAILARPGRNQVETSHLFCKGFFEPCIAAGFRPALLMLRRDLRATALSLLRKQAVPGRTGGGLRYLMTPQDRPYLGLDGGGAGLSDFQLCYWYCLEIALRQQLYAEIAAGLGLRVAWLDLGDLGSLDRLAGTAAALGLADADAARAALAGVALETVYNAGTRAAAEGVETDLDAAEAAVRARLLQPATAAGVQARIDAARRWL